MVLSQASHWAFAAGRVHLALHSWANFRLVNVRAAVVVVVWQLFECCGQLTRLSLVVVVAVVDLI